MEYLSDYDCKISYHPGKGNVVADALSRKPTGTLSSLMVQEWKLLEEFSELDLQISQREDKHFLANLVVQPTLLQRIAEAQKSDLELIEMMKTEELRIKNRLRLADDGLIKIGDRICVPQVDDIRQEILNDAHKSKLTVHPGSTKMYQNLRGLFWWCGMKTDIAEFVSRCLTCQ